MQEEYLSVVVRGPAATDIARKMFPCCPCPSIRLSLTISNLPKGTVIKMSTGNPVVVSFPSDPAGNLKFTLTVSATDQNNNPVTPTGLTASSDNPLVVPSTLNPDGTSFDILINSQDALTANVTVTDAFGNTLPVSVEQTSGGTPTITLSGVASTPVLQ